MDRSAAKSRFSEKKEKSYITCVLLGTLWSIVCAIMLLLVSCAVGMSLDDPEKYAPVFSLAALFISAFVAGFAGAKLRGRDGIATGLGAGASLSLLTVLLSLLLGEPLKLGLLAICIPIMLVTSLFAGISGANKGSSAPKHKHRKIKF